MSWLLFIRFFRTWRRRTAFMFLFLSGVVTTGSVDAGADPLPVSYLPDGPVAVEVGKTEGFNWRLNTGANAANTDFRKSWMSLASVGDHVYKVTVHIENSGNLNASNLTISAVLSNGWRFQQAEGHYEFIQSQQKPYGLLVECHVNPIAKGRSHQIEFFITLYSDDMEAPLFFAISSDYSQPVFAELTASSSKGRLPVWTSWFRQAWFYLALVVQEAWYRFLTGVTLIAYVIQISTARWSVG